MKLLAALNLILPFYLFASSVATLNVGGETYDSEKKTNLQLLMNSHNKLPPAVEFGLERHQIRKNKQNVRHAEEEEVFTTCMNDMESNTIELEYSFVINYLEAKAASVTCIEDGTVCTSDWSNIDLSAGEDVCKQHDRELYLLDAQFHGCPATNTGDDYKYSSDDPLDSAHSVLFIDYPLGCIPTSCDKEEIEDLFLSSFESCELILIESLYLYGEDASSTSGSMNPFNKKNQGIGMSLMIAGIIGTYA